MNTIDSLTISLGILAAVRLLGMLVFLDFFFQQRETKYIILILGWLAGAIGSSIGLYTHAMLGNMENVVTSMLGALGTYWIFCGALLYFDSIKPKFAYIGGALIFLYGLLPFANINTGPSPGVIIQVLSTIFLAFVVFFKRKLFWELARSSYYWLAVVALLSVGLTVAFAIGVIGPDTLALGFAGTTLLHVLMIIFFLHLEHSFSVRQMQEANQARQEEWERIIAVFNNFPEILYISDPETYEVLLVNKNLEESLGFDPVGKICFHAFQGFDKPCPFCTNEIILEKEEPYTWEYHNPVLDRYYMTTDQMIQWTDGRKVRFETAVDITERKKSEDHLKEYVKELEQFNNLTVGREKRMIQLKKEINALSKELGREQPYDLSFTDNV